MRMYAAVHGPIPGRSRSVRSASSRSAPTSRTRRPLASAAASASRAARRPPGRGRSAGSAARSASGVGKSCATPPDGVRSDSPNRSASRPARVRAPATETCWPRTARMPVSAGSTVPGTRLPGERRTSRPRTGSGRSASMIATGSASRSMRRRHRATAVARSRGSSRRRRQRTPSSTGTISTTAAPWGSRRLRRYAIPVHSSTPGTARAARNATSAAPSNGRRAASRSVISLGGFRRPADRRARSSEGEAANTSCIVALNWRIDSKPAANATSVAGRSVVSSRTRAAWARWARASASPLAPTSATSRRWTCRSE